MKKESDVCETLRVDPNVYGNLFQLEDRIELKNSCFRYVTAYSY